MRTSVRCTRPPPAPKRSSSCARASTTARSADGSGSQHGAGKKHERPITIEPWQRDIIDAAPWSFLRGCIRSDGCVFVNRTGPYEYLSYDFANWSADILDLFVATCESVGLRPRRYARHARLYRRADVGRLLDRVGLKS